MVINRRHILQCLRERFLEFKTLSLRSIQPFEVLYFLTKAILKEPFNIMTDNNLANKQLRLLEIEKSCVFNFPTENY